MQFTLAQFRQFALTYYGAYSDIAFFSEKHREFLEKLNRIGWRNAHIIPPESCINVDETVLLTLHEYEALLSELTALPQMAPPTAYIQ